MADDKTSTSHRIVVSASGVTLNLDSVTIAVPAATSVAIPGANAVTVTSGLVATLNVIADSSLTGGDGCAAGEENESGSAGGTGINGNVAVTGTATLTVTGGRGGSGRLPSPQNGRAGFGIRGNVNVSGTATLIAISGSGDAGMAIISASGSGGGTITVGDGYTVSAGPNATSASAMPTDSTFSNALYVAITPPTPQAKWGAANDGAAPSSWVGSGTLAAAMTYANSNSGTYIQLLTDIDKDNHTAWPLTFSQGKTTILDLNGKNIDRGLATATASGNVITVNGPLTIKDSSTADVSKQGCITGGYTSDDTGGGVYAYSTFTLQGGNITGNKTTNSGGGVSISAYCTFNMQGGSVADNEAVVSGGGVYALNNGTFNMKGGSVTGNKSANGGVYVGLQFKVGGSVVVKGNTLTDSSVERNAVIPTGKTIFVDSALVSGASIGVTAESVPTVGSPIVVAHSMSNDYSGYFFSDNSSYLIQKGASNNVQLAVPVTQAPTVTAVSPTGGSAAGGTSVAITGTNLSGATAVKFGSTSATSFTVISSTSITATAPAGTGTVDITVTTAGGTSATSAASKFTYALPTAAEYAVGAISPTDYSISGTTLTIYTDKGAAYWSANGASYLDYTVLLAADINVSDFLWTPVGSGSGSGAAFSGSFDGQGHSISGLTITAANESYAGLFGGASSPAIRNLCVSGTIEVTESNELYIGGISGCLNNNSTIRNCCSHVDIRSAANEVNAGGIVGWLESGTIENCFNTGDVSGTGTAAVIAGGIYGEISSYGGNSGIVKNSYNTGSVTGSGSSITWLGALGGNVGSNIVMENCYYLSGTASKAFGYGSDSNGSSFTAGEADDLLAALNGWVAATASTSYYTWTADSTTPANGGYPVFGAAWTSPVASPTFNFCNGAATASVKPTEPTWAGTGYTFADWYTMPNGEGTELTGDGDSGTTYYAKWMNNGKSVRTTALDLTDIGASKDTASD